MEDRKPRALDVLRLIIAILTLLCALFVGLVMCWVAYDLFTYDGEDTISGLVLLFAIPVMIGVFAYSIVAVKWIKKYNKNKDIPLIKRTVEPGECVVKIILAIFFLSYICIPFAVYWTMDLIEAIKRKKLCAKLKAKNIEVQYKTNETHPINEPNKCSHCGAVVDERYARFCENCGAEIQYRK